MAVLTKGQVSALWIAAGGPPQEARKAAEVATRESSRRTTVVNSIGAVGLMQIYDGHYPSPERIRQLQNPMQNMREAVAKYKARRWQPWAVCSDAACSNLNVDASFHIPNPLDMPGWGTIPNPLDAIPDGQGGTPDLTPDLPNPLTDPLAGITALAATIKRLVAIVANVVTKLGDPETYRNAGKILLGFILLTMALRRLFTLATS